MQNYSYALYPDELYHYGVKDMHWGVRNYQNKDGSLTALGRIHYGIEGMYNGPKMEHLKSQVARGWATANDPEFLGRSIKNLDRKLGNAATIALDKRLWKMDIKDVRDFVNNYFSQNKNYDNVNRSYSELDSTGGYGIAYSNTNVKTKNSPNAYDFGIGETYISVKDSYDIGKSIKMSDLADISIERSLIPGTKRLTKSGNIVQLEEVAVNRPIEGIVTGDMNIDVAGGNKKLSRERLVKQSGTSVENEYNKAISKALKNYKNRSLLNNETQQLILSQPTLDDARKVMNTVDSLLKAEGVMNGLKAEGDMLTTMASIQQDYKQAKKSQQLEFEVLKNADKVYDTMLISDLRDAYNGVRPTYNDKKGKQRTYFDYVGPDADWDEDSYLQPWL